MQPLCSLRRCFLVAVVINEVWAMNTAISNAEEHLALSPPQLSATYQLVAHDVVRGGQVPSIPPLEEVLESVTRSRERTAAALATPAAQPPLRKRQDDGQLQALSSQLQSLSQSATQALSSVSSSASSAISLAQSQVSQQLSQTQSSASSALSSASSQASAQLSQSLASMSSRLSVSVSSAQSSASSAVSSAQLVASQFAASQIQAARASLGGQTGGDTPTTTPAQQGRPSTLSEATLAIIITASVVGTAILSTIVSCLVLRYRRKKKPVADEKAAVGSEKPRDNVIAVRGSSYLPSPRLGRFGGATLSPLSGFKLPRLSPLVQAKKAQQAEEPKIGLAVSDYDNVPGMNTANMGSRETRAGKESDTIPQKSSLSQKTNGLSKATSVRLIRIGSKKSTEERAPDGQKEMKKEIPRRPIATESHSLSQTQPPSSDTVTEPPKAKEPPPRQTQARMAVQSDRDSRTTDRRTTMRSTMTTQNSLRFRDSSDADSLAPTPTNIRNTITALKNTDTASLRMSRPGKGYPVASLRASQSRSKNAGASFTTFPRTPSQTTRESTSTRPRPGDDGSPAQLRREEESRLRELAEMRSMGRGSIVTRISSGGRSGNGKASDR